MANSPSRARFSSALLEVVRLLQLVLVLLVSSYLMPVQEAVPNAVPAQQYGITSVVSTSVQVLPSAQTTQPRCQHTPLLFRATSAKQAMCMCKASAELAARLGTEPWHYPLMQKWAWHI